MRKERRKQEAQALEVMGELGPSQVGCGWISSDLHYQIWLDLTRSGWWTLGVADVQRLPLQLAIV